MHMRLTAVLLTGLVAFAGTMPPNRVVSEDPGSTPSPRYAFPSIDRFDDLGPTSPSSTGATQQERVTVVTRAIPLPTAASAHAVTRSDLARAGVLVTAYRSAADAAPQSCHLPVTLLAAIGQIESGSAGGRQVGADHVVRPGIFGPLLDGGPFAVIRDTDNGALDGNRSWDRAVGPMQFIPSTWARAGVDGDGDGRADPQNVYDAAHSAAGYLCGYGRDLASPSDLRAAIYSYNQSDAYVLAVLEWMLYFDARGLDAVGSVGFRVGSGGRASQLPAVEGGTTTLTTSSPRSTTAATRPTATTGATPAARTTTPGPTTTGTRTPAPTTTTVTTSRPTSTTTAGPTTSTPGTSTTTTPACQSPTTTVTVTPSPTTTVTVTASPTTTPAPTTTTAPTTATPTTSPTSCSGTATVTATPTATTTTTATEGATSR